MVINNEKSRTQSSIDNYVKTNQHSLCVVSFFLKKLKNLKHNHYFNSYFNKKINNDCWITIPDYLNKVLAAQVIVID